MNQRIVKSDQQKQQQKKGKDAFKIKYKANIIQAGFTELQNAICHEKTDDTIELIQNNVKIPENPINTFNELIKGRFSDQILHAINDLEYHQPTKIQNEVISILNEKNQDLIAQSYSYTGKKIAFLISMMLRINKDIQLPQTICLFDTVNQSLCSFNIFTKLNAYTNFKGGICVNDEEQPPKDSQLLFGTPPYILRLIKTSKIDISNVNLLIINNANTIFDPALCRNYDAATSLLQILPKTVQFGFFSEKLPESLLKFVKKMRPNIVSIFTPKSEQCTTVEHWYTKVSNIEEAKMIMYDLVKINPNCKTIIFTLSEDFLNPISDFLNEKGIPCAAYLTDSSIEKHGQILRSFKNNELKVLVVDDISLGGYYFHDKDLVINYQVPSKMEVKSMSQKSGYGKKSEGEKIEVADCSSYKRRSTRVGHFGKKGVCFTIVTNENDEKNLYEICCEKKLNFPIKFIDKTQFK